jgi:drug/metabolite transporter (DMT)-like permease
MLGTAILGVYAGDPTPNDAFALSDFVWYNVLLLGGVAALSVFTLLARYVGACPIFSITAGVMGGVSILYQKIFVDPLLQEFTLGRLAGLLTDPYFLIFLVVGNGAFVVFQVAFQFGRAVVVVPLYSAAFILAPIVGGMMVFKETVGLWQSLGVAAVLAGIVLLTAVSGGRPAAAPVAVPSLADKGRAG